MDLVLICFVGDLATTGEIRRRGSDRQNILYYGLP